MNATVILVSVLAILVPFGILFGVKMFRDLIHPKIYDRITILNPSGEDDVFFIKKRKGYLIDKDMKQVRLYTNEKDKDGELYSMPLKDRDEYKIKRTSERGHSSYYFFRNNPNPIVFETSHDSPKAYDKNFSQGNLRLIQDSQLLAKVQDSSVMTELLSTAEKSPNKWLIIAIIALVIIMMLLFLFKDETICKNSIEAAIRLTNATAHMPVRA